MGKRKIRNYLMNTRLQLRMTLHCILPALALSVLTGAIVFVIVWPLMAEYLPETIIPYLQRVIIVALLIESFGIICLVTAWGIVITHRVAGPLYRIEEQIKNVLQGNPIEPLRLRRGDEFQELAELINQVVEQYEPKR